MGCISRRDVIRTAGVGLVAILGSSAATGMATTPPNGDELDSAPAPPDIVEKARIAHGSKNHVTRDKIESVTLDLIPGTRTFRYVLPPAPPPDGGSEH